MGIGSSEVLPYHPQETERGFSFHVNLILTLYLLAHYSVSKGNIPTVSIGHYGKVQGIPNYCKELNLYESNDKSAEP